MGKERLAFPKARKALKARRSVGGIERKYPEDMSRLRRVTAPVLSALNLDPVVRRDGVVRSRNARFVGERVVRASGIEETKRSLPILPSAEGVRYAFTSRPLPGYSPGPEGGQPVQSPFESPLPSEPQEAAEPQGEVYG